jgi:ankyrin repeat protein
MDIDLSRMIFEERFHDVKRYVEMKAPDLNVAGSDGLTPLEDAIESDNADLVEFMLLHGADPNISIDEHLTALQLAVEQAVYTNDYRDQGVGDPATDVIEVLLRYGADMNQKSSFDGNNALTMAKGWHPRAYELFQEWIASHRLNSGSDSEVQQ